MWCVGHIVWVKQPDFKITRVILPYPFVDCFELMAFWAGRCLCSQNINKYSNKPPIWQEIIFRRFGYFSLFNIYLGRYNTYVIFIRKPFSSMKCADIYWLCDKCDRPGVKQFRLPLFWLLQKLLTFAHFFSPSRKLRGRCLCYAICSPTKHYCFFNCLMAADHLIVIM